MVFLIVFQLRDYYFFKDPSMEYDCGRGGRVCECVIRRSRGEDAL